MEELITNLHMHTRFSDGSGTHRKIGQAALQSGLDVVITTDHNVLVKGMDSIFQDGERRVLMIVSEEVHDQARDPQKNHLLAIGAEKELSTFARDPQILIDQVKMNGGLSFIAHPNDHAMKAFGEGDISWVDWDVHGFTGIELWNGLSEMKDRAHNKLQAVFLALFPQFLAEGPLPETLAKWDELLTSGQKVVAVGGSDAHALHMSMGPLHREIFPYEFHFQAINNHLLTPGPISGDVEADKAMVLAALAQGHSFIGYDLPASTRGFRFSAQGQDGTAGMGDEITLGSGVTIQIRLPKPTYCRLIRDGETVKTWGERQVCTYITNDPGVYRVEAYINFLGKRRGWIFSNPVYVLP